MLNLSWWVIRLFPLGGGGVFRPLPRGIESETLDFGGLAMSGDRGDNVRKAVYDPNQDSAGDNLRQVAFNPQECGKFQEMLPHMQTSNLFQRMDQFVGGTMRQNGLDMKQLDGMLQSDKFNDKDKKVFQYMKDNFAQAAPVLGNPERLSMGELQNHLAKAVFQACDQRGAPGQQRSKR